MYFTSAALAVFGAAAAVSASPLVSRSPLCTPQDKTGFIMRVRSGNPESSGKIIQLAPAGFTNPSIVKTGFGFSDATSNAWPFIDEKAGRMYIPGAGYKQNPNGFVDTEHKQLVFYYGGEKGAMTHFTTCCDQTGQFLLCGNNDIHWQACREEGGSYTIRQGLQGNGPCHAIQLEMFYGPPNQTPPKPNGCPAKYK